MSFVNNSPIRLSLLALLGVGLIGAVQSLGLPHQAVMAQQVQPSLQVQPNLDDPVFQKKVTDAVYLNQQGWGEMESGQAAAAQASFEKALAIFREIKAVAGEAQSLENLGTLQYRLGKLPEAMKFYQQALPLRRVAKDRAGEWATLDGIGDTYVALDKLDLGLESYQQALAIVRELKDNQSESYRLQKIAAVYFRLAKYDQAFAVYQQTLVLYRQRQDFEGIAVTLNNIGMAQANLGQYANALASYQEALNILESLRTYRGAKAVVLNNMAGVFFGLGQNDKALQLTQQALNLYNDRGTAEPDAALINRLSLLQTRLGQHGAPLELSQQGITIQQVNTGSSVSIFKMPELSQAHTLNNVARVHTNQREYAQAIKLYQESLAFFQRYQDRAGQAAVLNNLGQAEQGQGKAEQALKYYQQALDLYRQLRDRTGEGIVLSNLGQAHGQIKQYEQALQFYQQALAIHREVGDRPSEAVTLFKKASSQYQSGDLAEASLTLKESLKVLESLRPGLSDAQKISLFETQSLAYSLLQFILIQQKQPEEALVVAERGRARAFVEMLARRSQEGSNSAVNVNAALESPTIAQIRQVARDQKATLVQYSVIAGEKSGPDRLYIWVVSPTGQIAFRESQLTGENCQRLPCTSLSVFSLVNSGRDALGVRSRGLAFAENPQAAAPKPSPSPGLTLAGLQQLHRVLIDPIADLLPTDVNAQVVFIPHQALFMVPFATLQDAKGRHLIELHTLRIAPSIQVLQLTHQKRIAQRTLEGQETLIVGNPTMPKVRIALDAPAQELSSLPGAETEAKTIAKILNTNTLIGGQASETDVRTRMDRASVIHLATHGLLDDFDGLGFPGAIALAPDSKADGLLTASEILDLHLQANLVVLSACDTGRGRITGDGVVGLSRSLIIAGASSVIVSLWKVPDEPTAELMAEFYRNLQQNPNKAIALRKAMLTTAQKYPDPYDWAAFVLLGEAE